MEQNILQRCNSIFNFLDAITVTTMTKHLKEFGGGKVQDAIFKLNL